jgi:DNA-directed RNA polymerase specialized sigma24 family protein
VQKRFTADALRLDSELFTRFFTQYHQSGLRFARLQVGNARDKEEVMQKAWCNFCLRHERMREGPYNLLHEIIINISGKTNVVNNQIKEVVTPNPLFFW